MESQRIPLVLLPIFHYNNNSFVLPFGKGCFAMADTKKKPLMVSEYYDNLHELNGAVMDAASYEKHKGDLSAPEPEPTNPEPETASLQDIFSAPQDFRQIAAQQIEADRQMEYRPECVTYAVPQYTGETCMEIAEQHFVLGAPSLVRTGSGSYLRSGSYGSYTTSGSYRTSGSFYLRSGSFSFGSGSYRGSSSYPCTSGSFSSESFHIPSGPDADQPYLGSFAPDFAIGGYGLNLI